MEFLYYFVKAQKLRSLRLNLDHGYWQHASNSEVDQLHFDEKFTDFFSVRFVAVGDIMAALVAQVDNVCERESC